MKQVDLTGVKNWTVEEIPDYALSYIVNGEVGEDLTEEDIQNIDEWADKMREMGFTPDIFTLVMEENGEYYSAEYYAEECIEPSFTTNPAFGLPCNCYLCLFVDLG